MYVLIPVVAVLVGASSLDNPHGGKDPASGGGNLLPFPAALAARTFKPGARTLVRPRASQARTPTLERVAPAAAGRRLTVQLVRIDIVVVGIAAATVASVSLQALLRML